MLLVSIYYSVPSVTKIARNLVLIIFGLRLVNYIYLNFLAMLMTFSPFVPIVVYLIYAVIIYGKDAFKPLPTWKAANAKSQIEPFGEEPPAEKQAASNPAFVTTAEETTADL